MSSLLEEMDSMPSFDAPRVKAISSGTESSIASKQSSLRPTESSVLKQREKEEMAMKLAEHTPADPRAGKKRRGSKKRTPHSKFHGDAPVNLMTTFLTLVQSNQLQAALDFCPQILKYEPDNILIKMYQETMTEALRVDAEAKRDGTYESSSEEEEEEEEEEDESSSDERYTEEVDQLWPADSKIQPMGDADEKGSWKDGPTDKGSK